MQAKVKKSEKDTSWGYRLYVSDREAKENGLKNGEILDLTINARKMDEKKE